MMSQTRTMHSLNAFHSTYVARFPISLLFPSVQTSAPLRLCVRLFEIRFMTTLPKTISPPQRMLLGPGPSDVPPRVLAALAAPTVGHLDPYYLGIMDEMQSMLRAVFRTKNQMTLAVSGTGSAGQEACVVNLVEPGERVLVCINGVFGGRLADMAERAGGQVTQIERPWGEVFSVDEVKAGAGAASSRRSWRS